MSKSGTRAPDGAGTIRKDGYIQIKHPGHPVAMKRGFAFAHRVVLYDKIGSGAHPCHWCSTPVTWFVDLEIDHLDHKKANNKAENLVPCCRACNRGRWNREKTGCPHNHGPYDGATPKGLRYCKTCKRLKERRRRAASNRP